MEKNGRLIEKFGRLIVRDRKIPIRCIIRDGLPSDSDYSVFSQQ
jgi:hypothetical protein